MTDYSCAGFALLAARRRALFSQVRFACSAGWRGRPSLRRTSSQPLQAGHDHLHRMAGSRRGRPRADPTKTHRRLPARHRTPRDRTHIDRPDATHPTRREHCGTRLGRAPGDGELCIRLLLSEDDHIAEDTRASFGDDPARIAARLAARDWSDFAAPRSESGPAGVDGGRCACQDVTNPAVASALGARSPLVQAEQQPRPL